VAWAKLILFLRAILKEALPLLSCAQALKGLVDSDAYQPGGELRCSLELVDAAECLQEDVLRAVFGIIAVFGDADQRMVDATVVAADKLFEGI
jgi:hypothetical protein